MPQPTLSPDQPAVRHRLRALAAVTIALATLAACGSDDTSTAGAPTSGGESSSSGTEQAGATDSGGDLGSSSMFDGEATTVGGEPFDLGTLANQDLVIWFWAPW